MNMKPSNCKGGVWLLSVGEKVRRLRSRRGLSQEALAGLAGMGPSTVAHIETGSRQQLRPVTMQRLAEALHVPAVYFMTEDPTEYVRVRLATLPASEIAALDTPVARARWILTDLADKWGAPFELDSVAERLGVSVRHLQSVLDGRTEMSEHVLMEIAHVAGIPPVWFMTGDPGGTAPPLQEQYVAVMRLAQEAGLDPGLLRQQVELLVAMQKRGSL